MANKRITEFSEITEVLLNTIFAGVDPNDTTDSPEGTNVKIPMSSLKTLLDQLYATVGQVLGGGTRIISETHTLTDTMEYTVWQVVWTEDGLAQTVNFNQAVTISNGDDYYPRIDIVVLDTTDDTVYVVEGTADGPTAAPPSLDPTQLQLFQVLVPALATSITGVDDILVWDEDLGSDYGEWDAVATGTIVIGSIDDASNGTYSIKIPTGNNNRFVTITAASPETVENATLIMKFKQPTAHSYRFQVRWFDSTGPLTVVPGITVEGDVYGLDSTSTEWQTIAIPMPGITSVDTVQIVSTRNTNNFFLDEIYIQTGLPAPEIVEFLPTGGYTGTAQSLYNLIVNGYIPLPTEGTDGQVLTTDGDGTYTWEDTAGTGTVTSVAQTVPTGFTVSGSPVTTSGTLAVAYDTGYQGYTTAEATKLSGIKTSVVSDGNVSGATNLDFDNKYLGKKTMTADATFSAINVDPGDNPIMELTGDYTPTFSSMTGDPDNEAYDGTLVFRVVFHVDNSSNVKYFMKAITS